MAREEQLKKESGMLYILPIDYHLVRSYLPSLVNTDEAKRSFLVSLMALRRCEMNTVW